MRAGGHALRVCAAAERSRCRADERLHALLARGAAGSRRRKSVHWPDEAHEGGDGAFRLGRPLQLETVHVLRGLGPEGGGDGAERMRAGAVSFADAVRAEHSAEQTALRGAAARHSGR